MKKEIDLRYENIIKELEKMFGEILILQKRITILQVEMQEIEKIKEKI